ncbi:MAG: CsbD family protein [Desulfobulbus sp.]
MKSSIKDQAEGSFHQVKGKVKEVAGKLTGKPELEVDGKVEKNAGKAQEKIGEIKEVLGE